MSATKGELVRTFNATIVHQREGDGYWNATQMCQATGKKWADYCRNDGTKAFLEALSLEVGIPTSSLVQIRKGKPGGDASEQGTWVHRRVAVHLAQWCSAEFAVKVSGWVEELLTRGHVSIAPQAQMTAADVREIASRAAADAVAAALAAVPPGRMIGTFTPGPFWTVDTRLADRYPHWNATREQKHKIRKRANGMIRTLFGDVVEYDGHNDNASTAYRGPQILILDRVIDAVYRRERADGNIDDWGLYSGID